MGTLPGDSVCPGLLAAGASEVVSGRGRHYLGRTGNTNKGSEFPVGEAGPLPWGEKQGWEPGPPVVDCAAGRPS